MSGDKRHDHLKQQRDAFMNTKKGRGHIALPQQRRVAYDVRHMWLHSERGRMFRARGPNVIVDKRHNHLKLQRDAFMDTKKGRGCVAIPQQRRVAYDVGHTVHGRTVREAGQSYDSFTSIGRAIVQAKI